MLSEIDNRSIYRENCFFTMMPSTISRAAEAGI